MDVEVKAEKGQTYLKDNEVKELIKQSQSGDQGARDKIVQKICVLSGLSSRDS